MKYTFSLFLLFLSSLAVPSLAQLQLINTIAGTGVTGYSGDGGVATNAKLNGPVGVSVDKSGNVYLVDVYNRRVRKINTAGHIVTIAGTGVDGYTGDGSLGTSAEIDPAGIATDKNGNVYVSDANYNVVRKINTSGIISTVAGTGVLGYTGDNALAIHATLNQPCGLAVDTAGNLYIADAGNNVIRMIDSAGTISTFAGTGSAGYSGDDTFAVMAQLDSPYAVATDTRGNVYISDNKNNVIRKVDTAMKITTFAGVNNVYNYTGDSGLAKAATINSPRGIATDTLGQLYIADANNNVIRKVDTNGIITTAVGNGYAGFGGDLGTVNGANLYNPYGVAVDKYGSIYIADANNQRIRKSYSASLAVKTIVSGSIISVYPNPASNNIIVSGLAISDKMVIYDLTGRQVGNTNIATAVTQSYNLAGLVPGAYMLQVNDSDGNRKAVVRIIKD
jgi:streptogramin lyase